METKDRTMRLGDIVKVDVGFANGGYSAEIIWIGKHFARIKSDGEEWDIMKYRLTPIDKDELL